MSLRAKCFFFHTQSTAPPCPLLHKAPVFLSLFFLQFKSLSEVIKSRIGLLQYEAVDRHALRGLHTLLGVVIHVDVAATYVLSSDPLFPVHFLSPLRPENRHYRNDQREHVGTGLQSSASSIASTLVLLRFADIYVRIGGILHFRVVKSHLFRSLITSWWYWVSKRANCST